MDPWLWTTNDIIAELRCSTTLLHATDSTVESAPGLTPLEHYIREHQLTGAIFLTSFNIQVFDPVQQESLSSAIDSFRRRSVVYQGHFNTKRVELLDLNRGSTRQRSNSIDAHSDDETGRKKRKIAHVHTNMPADSHDRSEAVAKSNIEPMVEHTDAVEGTEWDHLLKWQELDGNEEISWAELDELEDEQQTGSEEVVEENADEQEQEEVQDEPVQSRSRLSEEQIVDIINERIAYYSNSWVPNKGVIRGEEIDYDVQKMWEDAEVEGRRPEKIAKHGGNMAYYRRRLDTLCNEIRKHPANNAEKLRKQCSNLEITIYSMLLEEWKLSIYELEPVNDSEQESDSPDSGTRQNRPGSPSNTLKNQGDSSMEIIDLGSPSEISDNERIVSVEFDEHIEPAMEVQENPPVRPHRSETPDFVVMDTIKPSLDVIPEQPTTAHTSTLSRSLVNNGDEPENASIGTVRRWRWSDLAATQDRKRIVSKAVNEMKPNDREEMRLRLRHVGKVHMIKEIPACLEMLSNGRTKMPGVLPRDQPKIVLLTKLFLSWWLCDNYFREDPAKWHLEELRKCLEADSPDPGTFCDYLSTIMSTTFSEEALRHPERPSQVEIIEISDDE